MIMNDPKIAISKFLSLVLRHKPDVIGATLDEEGWLSIEELIAKANEHQHPLTLELIHDVVATSDKRRFALSDDGLRIRANQGHSIPNIDLNLVESEPPALLYHGTVKAFMDSIGRSGLQKQSRNHVHLSPNRDTAIKVAQRRGVPIVLEVQAGRMNAAGYKFYLSTNGVWLTDSVPNQFLRVLTS